MDNRADFVYESYLNNNRTLKMLKIGFYIVSDEIGRGRYSQVYKAIDCIAGNIVVIKFIDIKELTFELSEQKKAIVLRSILREDLILSKFNHSNILKYMDSFSDSNFKLIITEFCEQGTLRQEIEREGSFNEQKAINVLEHLTHGIAEMHSQPKPVIHRDLKPENIFKQNNIYKIGDFGLSKEIQSNSEESIHTFCGSYTQAPEVKTKVYNLQADIWSLGAILYLMLDPASSIEQRLKNMMSQSRKKKFSLKLKNEKFASQRVITFLEQSLAIDPKERMTWKELKHHEIFKRSENKYFENYFTVSHQVDVSQISIDSIINNQASIILLDDEEEQSEKQRNPLQSSIFQNRCNLQRQYPRGLLSHNFEKERKKEREQSEALMDIYRRCKLTEEILSNYIIPLQLHEALDLSIQQHIELMYLLCARCYFYMSIDFGSENFQKFDKKSRRFAPQGMIKSLKAQSTKYYFKYSNLLTQKEHELKQIIKNSIMKKQKQGERNKFLSGIENLDFTAQEQICYTQHYLNRFVEEKDKLRSEDPYTSSLLLSKFKAYTRINSVSRQLLENAQFDQIVSQIIYNQS